MTQDDVPITMYQEQLCTCDHTRRLHGTEICDWGEGTSTGCSCNGFLRAHTGRRPNCWCVIEPLSDESTKAHEMDVTLPDMVPRYVQDALDQVREDLVLLSNQLRDWEKSEDMSLRVFNWHFNTWRHMEEILAAGVS